MSSSFLSATATSRQAVPYFFRSTGSATTRRRNARSAATLRAKALRSCSAASIPRSALTELSTKNSVPRAMRACSAFSAL